MFMDLFRRPLCHYRKLAVHKENLLEGRVDTFRWIPVNHIVSLMMREKIAASVI